MSTVNAYAKAIVAALIAFLTPIAVAMQQNIPLTAGVWIAAGIAALTALTGVALTTNTPKPTTPNTDGTYTVTTAAPASSIPAAVSAPVQVIPAPAAAPGGDPYATPGAQQ